MRKIKKTFFIIFFIIFSTLFLFCPPPVPISPSSTPSVNTQVNQENRENTILDKNKFINDKLEGLKINKDRNESINIKIRAMKNLS